MKRVYFFLLIMFLTTVLCFPQAENSACDSYRTCSALGVTDDANLETRMLRVVPATNRLMVDSLVAPGAGIFDVTITDGVNDVEVLNSCPAGGEWGLVVYPAQCAVNQGTPAVLESDRWWFQLTDGTNNPAIMNSDPVGTEYGLVVRNIGGDITPPGSTDPGNPVREIPPGPMYSCSHLFAPDANFTDMYVLRGSATKTLAVYRVKLRSYRGVSLVVNFYLSKRSTDNTGGVFASPNITPHNSAYPASTALVRAYTTNPVGLGALVGHLWIESHNLIATPEDVLEVDYVEMDPIILSGVNEVLSINCSDASSFGANLPGATCLFVWAEY